MSMPQWSACYTYRAINHIAATDMDILEKMNLQPEFWQVTSFSLESENSGAGREIYD
jgi:hypothetical protein